MAFTRMHVIKRRILRFAQEFDRLPHDLSAIPEIPGFDNSIRDDWGRPIMYHVGSGDVVTLTSFGRDGAPGGIDDSTDIICAFPTREVRGGWSNEFVDWLPDRD
jgi:hypothetical protein